MPDMQSWTTTIADFVNRVGISNVIVIFVLLMIGGIVPSAFTNQQQEIFLVVRQIRTISASVAGMRHAECINKADVDSEDNAAKFSRMVQRCHTAYDSLRVALESIGAEAAANDQVNK